VKGGCPHHSSHGAVRRVGLAVVVVKKAPSVSRVDLQQSSPRRHQSSASMLDGLDGRYLGPVKVRSSSRGCGQLKVLDCAMVWMLVRHAFSALAGPVRSDERYRVLEDCTSFTHARTWQQCQTSRRRRRNRKGRNHSVTTGNGPAARRSRRRSQQNGCSSVPARGRRMLGEEHGLRLRAHWSVRVTEASEHLRGS
jgi:hypothetical protein